MFSNKFYKITNFSATHFKHRICPYSVQPNTISPPASSCTSPLSTHTCMYFFIRRAAQQAAAAAVAAQAGSGSTRKLPPPFLRSQTLPTIILPSMAILNAQLDPSRLTPGKCGWWPRADHLSWPLWGGLVCSIWGGGGCVCDNGL